MNNTSIPSTNFIANTCYDPFPKTSLDYSKLKLIELCIELERNRKGKDLEYGSLEFVLYAYDSLYLKIF